MFAGIRAMGILSIADLSGRLARWKAVVRAASRSPQEVHRLHIAVSTWIHMQVFVQIFRVLTKRQVRCIIVTDAAILQSRAPILSTLSRTLMVSVPKSVISL